MPTPIMDAFADLPDPRRAVNQQYRFADLLVMTLAAALAGAGGPTEIARFVLATATSFTRLLDLPKGVPSHDPFRTALSGLDANTVAACVGRWMAAACEGTGLTPIAIDGKSVRGSKRETATGCLHLVSAGAAQHRLTLGQVAVADESNELAAIPVLLDILSWRGAVVTRDAAGCPVGNVAKIRETGGHYCLAVKDNQPTLHARIRKLFGQAVEADFRGIAYTQHGTTDTGHGRSEARSVTVIPVSGAMPAGFEGIKSLISVNRGRGVNGRNTSTSQYYVSDLKRSARYLDRLTRGHWGIESMHWVLDVVLGEDASRTTNKNLGENLAMLRKVAVSIVKNVPYDKAPKDKTIVGRLLDATIDEGDLTKLLAVSADQLQVEFALALG